MEKYLYSMIVATAMLASCAQDAEQNENVKTNAITSIGAATSKETRAAVSSTDNTKVLWETGDQLGTFGTGSSSVVAYTLSGEGGATSGTFTNNASSITAIQAMMYPCQSSATWSNAEGKLTCDIPSVQTAVTGSFDKNAAIMYSIGSSSNVTLDYAVNFLRVNVTETNVHAITISSDAPLSGTMEITSSGISAAATGALNSVTLVAPGTSSSCLATGYYYIAVKAGNITNPCISYTYIRDKSALVKKKQSATAITFASGTNLKNVSVDFSKGTVNVQFAYQLWADGPYFAQVNVGANSSSDAGGYYAWGGAQDKVDDHYNGTTDLVGYYDTATRCWGTAWRLPSKTEYETMLASCDTQYESASVKGLRVTGKSNYSGNSILLPLAGYCFNGNVINVSGNYMSSTHLSANKSYYFAFNSTEKGIYDSSREYGFSVRAVLR